MTTVIRGDYDPIDWVLPRGSDRVLQFRIMEPVPSNDYADMSGHTVKFRAARKGVVIERSLTSFGTYAGKSCVAAVILTRAELRLLSQEPTPYELEDWFGGNQSTFAGGDLYGSGGVNPDA